MNPKNQLAPYKLEQKTRLIIYHGLMKPYWNKNIAHIPLIYRDKDITFRKGYKQLFIALC